MKIIMFLIFLIWIISIPFVYLMVRYDVKKSCFSWTLGDRFFAFFIGVIGGPLSFIFGIIYLPLKYYVFSYIKKIDLNKEVDW